MINETETRLANIAAPGVLEKLVALYLRSECPEPFRGLVETGHNKEGKTVKDPVDGLCVSGSGANRNYGYMQVTTMLLDPESKWIEKVKDDMDQAMQVFRSAAPPPGSQITIAIGSNRRFGAKSNLYVEINNYATSLGAQIELVEASRLIKFLCNDATGQYWRKQLLGMNAEQLSIELLDRICRATHVAHSRSFNIPDLHSFIRRDVEKSIISELQSRGGPLVILEGLSGMGKSVVLNYVAQTAQDNGRPVIWIDQITAENSVSLPEALRDVLLRYEPTLSATAGYDALRLTSDSGLICIVDDVARARNPLDLRTKLGSWVGYGNSMTLMPEILAHRIVMTSFPGSSEVDRSPSARDRVRIQIGPFNDQELVQYISQLGPQQNKQFGRLLESVGRDPFIFGILKRDMPNLLIEDMPFGMSGLGRLINRYIENCLRDERLTSQGISISDFQSFIVKLLERVLEERTPSPILDSIFWQTSPLEKSIALDAFATAHLGSISDSTDTCQFFWGHDRLSNVWIGWHLSKLWVNAPLEATKYLARPELSESWAYAVVCVSQNHRKSLLQGLRQSLQDALPHIAALRVFNDADPFFAEFTSYLEEHLTCCLKIEQIGSARASAAITTLAQADPTVVIRATECFIHDWRVRLARAHAGNIDAAIALAAIDDFTPQSRWNQIEQAVHDFARHWVSKIDELSRELEVSFSDPKKAKSSLVLAGYLGFSELSPALERMWNAVSQLDRVNNVLEWIWALSRCSSANTVSICETAINIAASECERLNSEQENRGYSTIVNPLIQSARFPFTDASIDAWLRCANGNLAFSDSAYMVLRRQDNPRAAEAYVRHLS
ncbi:MAG: hypothetical protein ACKVS6_04915, partial [Planctomycetota bacterium]